MKDRFFYPLAFLIVLVIVGFALRPGFSSNAPSTQEILETGFNVSGDNLRDLLTPPGMFVENVENTDGIVQYAILKTNIPVEMAQPSSGVFIALDPVYEKAFSGRLLKVTINARAGAKDPLDIFKAAYFSGGRTSGWKGFSLTSDFEDYELTFKPPAKDKVRWREYVGIWPGDAGDSRTIEVKSIKIDVIKE